MTADDSTVLKVDQNNFLSKGQNIYYLSSSMQLLVGSALEARAPEAVSQASDIAGERCSSC